MCGCLPTSDRPSSECDASSKNSSDRLCAARALTAMSGPLTAMRSACGIARASNRPFSLHALPLAFAEQRDHVRHGVDAADQELARDVDVGAVAQRARHDRLDHGEDVLDPVVELVDHGGEPPLEADPHLDFAAEPQIVVGDIAEQAADDAGQREPDRADDGGGLLGALGRVGLGVIGERPVAVAEGHGPHRRRRRARRLRPCARRRCPGRWRSVRHPRCAGPSARPKTATDRHWSASAGRARRKR